MDSSRNNNPINRNIVMVRAIIIKSKTNYKIKKIKSKTTKIIKELNIKITYLLKK